MKNIILKLFENDELLLKKYGKQKFITRNIRLENFKIQWFVWLRWTWKTTFLLQQRIKINNSLYISCDDIILKTSNLFEIIKEINKAYNIETFFLDEIQFVEDWANILKNIYDFLDVNIVFTGSSMINLLSNSIDLSRRVLINTIYPFTYKEFEQLNNNNLNTISFEDILKKSFEISKKYSANISLLKFQEYLSYGQFGYYYEFKDKNIFSKLLENSIRKSIYEDLSQFVDLHTTNLSKLEKMLLFLTSSASSEISINLLSKKLQINHKTCEKYLEYLEKLGWIISISKYGKISENIRKEQKIYFTNTNIIHTLANSLVDESILRWNIRESFVVSNLFRIKEKYNLEIYFQSKTDLVVIYKNKTYQFEIWWKNKKRNDVITIKDDILLWDKNIIPLWMFWFLD